MPGTKLMIRRHAADDAPHGAIIVDARDALEITAPGLDRAAVRAALAGLVDRAVVNGEKPVTDELVKM